MHIKESETVQSGEGGDVGRALPKSDFSSLAYQCEPWRIGAVGAALSLPQTPSVFAIGNGFIGVRGPGEPPAAPRIYLNGVHERVPISYHEAAHGYASESDTRMAVADATRPRITIDGRDGHAISAASLDFATGCCVETLDFDGTEVRVERFASMARPSLVVMRVLAPAGTQIEVKPDVQPPPGAHGVSDGVYDPRIAPQLACSPWRNLQLIDEPGLVGRVDRLARSGREVAALCAEIGRNSDDGQNAVEFVACYAAAEADALVEARQALQDAIAAGFAALAREQRKWFVDHWRATELSLADSPAAEGAVRHGMLQLVQAVARDGGGSLAAKGQTGEGYEGHIFWDADLYALPVFAWTRPDIARAMLAWRISGLEAARSNARAMGHAKGALFPWRTISGRECSSFFPAGSAQYHINADIAFALRAYLDASGDRSILAEGGAELLAETARIWLQIGFHDPDRGNAFVINRVTGPDEYSAIVDNNLYTNMLAAEHLRFAAAEGRVSDEEAAAMRRAADAMLLPFDDARQVFAQDDRFFQKQPWPFATTPDAHFPLLLHYHPLTIYRHQVAKQADAVLAVALLPERFAPDMRRRMIDTYEAITVHDSTLSASAFATAAARARDAERAFSYWRASTLTDLADLFGNSGHGLHMAALAGSWSSIAFGFAGLCVRDERLCFDPIPQPELGRYAFAVRFRQSRVQLSVTGRHVSYTRLEGPPVPLMHGDEPLLLAEIPISRPVQQ